MNNVVKPQAPILLKDPLPPQTKHHPVVSKSALTGAAEDASRVMFDLLGMEFDQELVDKFMSTRDGKRMEASMARLFNHIGEELIARLDRQAEK